MTIGRRAAWISPISSINPKCPTTWAAYCQIPQDHGLDKALDNTVLLKLCEPALARKEKVTATLDIKNVNRVVGTILGSEITRRHGAAGLPEDTIKIHFRGSAGQSFGAFMPRGDDLDPGRRRQRLFGQGPFGRKNHPLSAGRLHLCGGGKHHHRQRRPLRRDRRRGLHPRHGGRTLLRPQQRRFAPWWNPSAITAANT